MPKDKRYPKQILTLGDQLKCKRLDELLTVERVCKDLKIPSATLWHWENNRTKPRRENEKKIKKYLRKN